MTFNINDYKEGRYRFGKEVYIVTHLDSTIKISNGDKYYQSSYMDISDMISDEILRTGRNIKSPLYYLFYKFDTADIISGYHENEYDETHCELLEKEASEKWNKYIN